MKGSNYFQTVWGLLHVRVRRPIEMALGEFYVDDKAGTDGYDEDGRPIITAKPPGIEGDAEELVKRIARNRERD